MVPVFQQMLWQMLTMVSAPAFWMMAGVVYLQVRRRTIQKEDMFQVRREPVIGLTVRMLLAGLAGGMLASILLLLTGAALECIRLELVWILALLLMMIRQRFFCFAYAGGILACLHCLTGWPNLAVSHLLMMVAVLHCTEAFLVLVTGHWNALPVYLRDEQGRMTGGFLLQMTWPLPLIMLFAMTGDSGPPQAGFFLFPEWWPLMEHPQDGAGNHLYMLLPVLAALGYGDAAVHQTIIRKTRQSAGYLLCYSACLMLLVLLTDNQGMWQLLPALFAPIGHEAVIRAGKNQKAIANGPYRAPEYGVKILDVQKGSPAARAGLRREDWIIALDGKPVKNRKHFLEQANCLSQDVLLEYRRNGKTRSARLAMHNTMQTGIITVPDDDCPIYWALEDDAGFVKFIYKKCEKTLKKIR